MSIDRHKVIDSAQKYAAKGQWDKAIAEYGKVLKEDPKDVRILQKVAELQLKRGSKDDAIATYARVAKNYDDEGFTTKAIAVYRQILSIDPNLTELYTKLADLYVKHGLIPDALANLDALASRYARLGNDQLLLSVYKQMTQVDPTNVACHIKLAELCSKLGRNDEAAESFENGAALLRDSGRADDWAKVAERLLFHRPNNDDLAKELAKHYLDRHDARNALPKLQICFKNNPKDVSTLEMLALAFKEIGQLPKTISVLKEVARIHFDQGRPEVRIEVLKRVLELAPGDVEAREAVHGRPRPSGAPGPAGASASMASRGMRPPGASPSGQFAATGGASARGAHPAMAATVAAPSSAALGARPSAVTVEPDEIEYVDEVDETGAGRRSQLTRMQGQAAGASKPAGAPNLPVPPPKGGAAPKPAGAPNLPVPPPAFDPNARPPAGTVAYTPSMAPPGPGPKLPAPPPPPPSARARKPSGADMAAVTAEPVAPVAPAASKPPLPVPPPPASGKDREPARVALDPPPPRPSAPPPRMAREPEPFTPPAPPPPTAAVTRPVAAPVAPEPVASAPVGLQPLEQPSDEAVAEAARMVGEADVFLKYGLRPKAIAHLERAAEIDPTSIDVHVHLRDLYAEAGDAVTTVKHSLVLAQIVGPSDPATALAEVEHALQILPGDPDALALYQQLAAALGIAPAADASAGAPGFSAEDAAAFDQQEQGEYGDDSTGQVHLPPEGATDVEEALDEVEFFVSQGMFDDAFDSLRVLLERHPNHPVVLERWAEVEALAQQAPAPAEDQSFALAEKLAEEVSAQGSTGGHFNAGNEMLDVESVFAQFKKGVEKAVSADDVDTHYDLGIAYREMGLIDDAISEFAVASQGTKKQCLCFTMIGLCYMEKGEVALAIENFGHALSSPNRQPREEAGLYYELGNAYETVQQYGDALAFFERVYEYDPNFRDIAERVQRLRAYFAGEGEQAQPPQETDDVDRAFDGIVKG